MSEYAAELRDYEPRDLGKHTNLERVSVGSTKYVKLIGHHYIFLIKYIIKRRYKLTFLCEKQQEGGYTITCRELPELITECDSLDELMDNVEDALIAVIELYEYLGNPLPKNILSMDDSNEEHQLLEMVIPFNELPESNTKTQAAWV